MSLEHMIGTWVAAFLTLCIFSFLYFDNPFYKFAEHVFVGVSAGYWMVLAFWQTLKPNLWDNLMQGHLPYLVPLVLGVMLLMQLAPKGSSISRWPIAFGVGIYAGQNIVYTLQSQVISQISDTIRPLWGVHGVDLLINWIMVVGVITGLIYFYFSVDHRAPALKVSSRIGIWVLMIAFGAGFGNTVMARISILIGRIMFFTDDWWPVAKATFHL